MPGPVSPSDPMPGRQAHLRNELTCKGARRKCLLASELRRECTERAEHVRSREVGLRQASTVRSARTPRGCRKPRRTEGACKGVEGRRGEEIKWEGGQEKFAAPPLRLRTQRNASRQSARGPLGRRGLALQVQRARGHRRNATEHHCGNKPGRERTESERQRAPSARCLQEDTARRSIRGTAAPTAGPRQECEAVVNEEQVR